MPGGSLVVAELSAPAESSTATPRKDWYTVAGITERVSSQASALGKLTAQLTFTPFGRRLAGEPGDPDRKDALGLAESAKAHEDAAKTHEKQQELAAARTEVDKGINDLERLAELAEYLAPGLVEYGRLLQWAAAETGRDVQLHRQALGGYGAYNDRGTAENPSVGPDEVVSSAAEYVEALVDFMKEHAPNEMADPTVAQKVEELRQRVDTYAKNPEINPNRDQVQDAVAALDELVVLADTLGHKVGRQGEQLTTAAQSAKSMVEEARRAAEHLPTQPPRGTELDEPRSPDGQPIRQASGGDGQDPPPTIAVVGQDPDGAAARVPTVLEAGSGSQQDHVGGPVQLAGNQQPATLALDASATSSDDGLSDPFSNQPANDVLAASTTGDDANSSVGDGGLSLTGSVVS